MIWDLSKYSHTAGLGWLKAGGAIRARNNFWIVSGHDDRPNSFLLGHVSFLAGQMYMMNYSFRGP